MRDLDQAHHWHQRALDLTPENDHIGRAPAYGNLGGVAFDRFLNARATGAPAAQLGKLFEQARADNQRSLDLLPEDHHQYRGNADNRLGTIYAEVGDVPTVLTQFSTLSTTTRPAATTTRPDRHGSTVLLGFNGRAGDALYYARAALTNYRQIGPGAAPAAARAEQLIQQLERIADSQTQ